MKFLIQSVYVTNSWCKNPDLKMVELYPILKDKLATINIANDSEKGYHSINVVEVESLEELMQLIDKFNCDVIVGKSIVEEYAQYDITGKIIIYDDYIEDKWRVRKYES